MSGIEPATLDGIEPAPEPSDAPVWPPEELVLRLRKPVIDKAGSEIAELRLREPTDDEWVKFFSHPPETRRRFAISQIAAVEMASVARIGIGDLMRAEAYLWAFFELGQEIRAW